MFQLRHDMIDQKEGETELSVKIHYDNMVRSIGKSITTLRDELISLRFQRRVTTRRHKYFYNPIEGTPFSLGVAIPEGYGMYELLAEQEIKHSQKNGNVKLFILFVTINDYRFIAVEEYFKGNNWKVHPDW